MIFKVKGGTHEQNGKSYKKGDFVDTELPLTEMFRGKFERQFDQETLKDTGVVSKISKPNITPPPLGGSKAVTAELPSKEKEAVLDIKDETFVEEYPESLYGTDVTDKYPTAEEVHVKVFEKSKWCVIVDPIDERVLNDKKLRGKDVEDFLEDLLPLKDTADIDEDVLDED
jgi:hypothetical protein